MCTLVLMLHVLDAFESPTPAGVPGVPGIVDGASKQAALTRAAAHLHPAALLEPTIQPMFYGGTRQS